MVYLLSPDTFAFLEDLAAHNHRSWMDAHRDRYEAARADMLGLIDAILEELAAFEPAARTLTPRQAILRINRDIRFSPNKAPYKDYLGAIFTRGGGHRSSYPDYYLHLSPGNRSFLAGGCYQPSRDYLKRIRAHVAHLTTDLRAILDEPDFQAYFGELEGETLKTSPQGYPADHPALDLLNHKSLAVSHALTDAEVLSESLVPQVIEGFARVKPLVDFLAEAIESGEEGTESLWEG